MGEHLTPGIPGSDNDTITQTDKGSEPALVLRAMIQACMRWESSNSTTEMKQREGSLLHSRKGLLTKKEEENLWAGQ